MRTFLRGWSCAVLLSLLFCVTVAGAERVETAVDAPAGGTQLAAAEPSPSSTTQAKTPAKIEFDEFIVVLLVRPLNAPQLAEPELKLQEGHMENMRTLASEGKLLKAGPFEDYSGRNVRGMFILSTTSQETAREWIRDDPLIKAGRLVPEYLKWYVEKGSLR